ncbi:MAG: hypothetical protein II269_00485 [Bacteroidaceae bacterium]|nr:hypothetical protein [Bacteroidaceae bacterium]
MKIETKGNELYIDGKVYDSMTDDERKNVWMRCIDYMRTHYNQTLAEHIARCVPCYFGKFLPYEGFSIEI